MVDIAADLRQLATLRADGLLTDEEFAQAKRRLLESGDGADRAPDEHVHDDTDAAAVCAACGTPLRHCPTCGSAYDLRPDPSAP